MQKPTHWLFVPTPGHKYPQTPHMPVILLHQTDIIVKVSKSRSIIILAGSQLMGRVSVMVMWLVSWKRSTRESAPSLTVHVPCIHRSDVSHQAVLWVIADGLGPAHSVS